MPVLVIVMIIGFTVMAALIIRKSSRPQAGRRRRGPTSNLTDDSLDTSLLGAAVLTNSDLFTTSDPIHDWAAGDADHAEPVDVAAMCVEEPTGPADLSQDSVEACDVGSGSDTGSSADDSSSSSSD
jgi:hypothetical protein